MTAVTTSVRNDVVVPTAIAEAAASTRKQGKRLGLMFWLAVSWLVLVSLAALFADFLPLESLKKTDLLEAFAVQSGERSWLRTLWSPTLGRSLIGEPTLTQLVYGARSSLLIAFGTVIFGFVIGGALGMTSGYFQGRFDSALSFAMTALQSFPPLLFLLLMVTVRTKRDPSTPTSINSTPLLLLFSLGILSIPTLYRVVRVSTMVFSAREFVLAAKASGAKTGRVLLKEILPNVIKPMLAFGLVAAGTVMVIEGGLSFIGIGVGNAESWGKMISTGATTLRSAESAFKTPHLWAVPSLALLFTVLSFNHVGDKLRQRFEVKESGI